MRFPTLIILLLLLPVAGCQRSNVVLFNARSDSLCDLAVRLDHGCPSVEPAARSRIECTTRCASNRTCIGVRIVGDDQCFLHDKCPDIHECANITVGHTYLSRCRYGTWDAPSQSCKCDNGFRGAKCDQGFVTCRDLQSDGYPDGIHRVFLDPEQDGINPFPVYCQFYSQNPKYNIVFFRNGGRGDFNKTWDEYVHGFYMDDDHFWMGLENLRLVTETAGCPGRMQYTYQFSEENRGIVYIKISDFALTTDYRISYGAQLSNNWLAVPSGSYFGLCLDPVKNATFSTWDQDNDGVADTNCASRAGSGWWYKGSCDNPCNALGYGFDYFDSKPSYQLFSLIGVDMTADNVKMWNDPGFRMVKQCDD